MHFSTMIYMLFEPLNYKKKVAWAPLCFLQCRGGGTSWEDWNTYIYPTIGYSWANLELDTTALHKVHVRDHSSITSAKRWVGVAKCWREQNIKKYPFRAHKKVNFFWNFSSELFSCGVYFMSIFFPTLVLFIRKNIYVCG